MKRALLTYLLLTALATSSFAQTYSTFKLSTNKPEAGKPVKYVYTGANSRQLFPDLSLHYKQGLRVGGKGLRGKPTSKGNEGSFVLPDSIKAFHVKTYANVKPAEFYVFQVYQNGKMIPGSLAESAEFYADAPEYRYPLSVSKALELYRQEFKLHPQVSSQYLIPYYAAAAKEPDQEIVQELEKTWQDSLKNGSSENFLVELFNVTSKYPAMPLKQGLKEKILTKYPGGFVALYKAKSNLTYYHRDYVKLSDIENKFSNLIKAGALDSMYSGWALAEFKEDNMDLGKSLLNKIQNRKVQEDVYNQLIDELKLQPPPPWGKPDLKSVDFTLKDLDGKPFTLSDHLGKTVVLYFFKTNLSSEYRYEMNTRFIEVASSQQSKKDILFVGIDRSSVYNSNEANQVPERIKRAKQYVAGEKSNFKIILDELVKEPEQKNSHFKVSQLYNSNPGLFYIIDKKGMLRYRYYFDSTSGIPGLTLFRALNAIK